VILLGVVLLIIGFITAVKIIWVLGIIAVVIGAILAILGATGRAVAGRSHWY
jgi:membrane-bound ClpP family serine protease